MQWLASKEINDTIRRNMQHSFSTTKDNKTSQQNRMIDVLFYQNTYSGNKYTM